MMIVGTELLPAHAAISRDWKVHFVTADMADNERNRAEDARFIEDPHAVLPTAAFSALTRIAALMQLDYAGVDFSIDSSGRLVVFEANAAMSIVPPHSDRRWDYRRAAIERIFTAFDRLVRTP